jgi:hypothetical protein
VLLRPSNIWAEEVSLDDGSLLCSDSLLLLLVPIKRLHSLIIIIINSILGTVIRT